MNPDYEIKCINGECHAFKYCRWHNSYLYEKFKDNELYKHMIFSRKGGRRCTNFYKKKVDIHHKIGD